jgi:hypothetical protein
MSAGLHTQISILRGETSFNMRIDFNKQNENFVKSAPAPGSKMNNLLRLHL